MLQLHSIAEVVLAVEMEGHQKPGHENKVRITYEAFGHFSILDILDW